MLSGAAAATDEAAPCGVDPAGDAMLSDAAAAPQQAAKRKRLSNGEALPMPQSQKSRTTDSSACVHCKMHHFKCNDARPCMTCKKKKPSLPCSKDLIGDIMPYRYLHVIYGSGAEVPHWAADEDGAPNTPRTVHLYYPRHAQPPVTSECLEFSVRRFHESTKFVLDEPWALKDGGTEYLASVPYALVGDAALNSDKVAGYICRQFEPLLAQVLAEAPHDLIRKTLEEVQRFQRFDGVKDTIDLKYGTSKVKKMVRVPFAVQAMRSVDCHYRSRRSSEPSKSS
jgi:hypothetical protein